MTLRNLIALIESITDPYQVDIDQIEPMLSFHTRCPRHTTSVIGSAPTAKSRRSSTFGGATVGGSATTTGRGGTGAGGGGVEHAARVSNVTRQRTHGA